MSLKKELSRPTLVEDKDNELAIEEEPLLKMMQVKEQHPLVGVDKFNIPIDSLTMGMEEDRQISSIERLSIATSQVWIDAEHGEMNLLVTEEKVKFDPHQSISLK